MYQRLQGKPYIVLLFVYWVVLFIRLVYMKPNTLRLLFGWAVCCLALADCRYWSLLITIPVVWVAPRTRGR